MSGTPANLLPVTLSRSLWVMPLIMLPENTPRIMIAQFMETVGRGGRFLQPTSRALAVGLVALTVLTARHPDTDVAARWKYHAAAGFVIVQTAWYEIVYIFPINDKIAAIGSKEKLSEDDRKKLISLMEGWQRLQWGRILLPLAAGIIGFLAVLKQPE